MENKLLLVGVDEVSDMPRTRADFKAVLQELLDGLHFGRRFDDHQLAEASYLEV